ncbi:flagellar biosynthesis protein FlhA [Ferrimonas lipolytica]|uniref:Flagellar biosynthesis protein FlhA n=1 Tax=Ferrimonas lipolytica TaxID=2724191 RepID=A0A6H1UDZ9_9GAMM|nr:flagellar biosynthesis protein FlhA [Ferrimonas lipolytica]QIZ76820.1 flagellar biosynthesis protein FlhA [Ferrimonas lipolytica]
MLKSLPLALKQNTNVIAVPLLLLAMLGMIILPIPSWLLDILFTFNIILAIMVLLVSVSVRRPLEFSLFPTVLLLATLLRLTLNVASTRVVLIEGHQGGDAAGKVIQAFGDVVIGGNYVVGAVVFLILMIINFVVITKGGERISEVSARFTLDALPGKQMAIDADLNTGAISQDQARQRRKDVTDEADFYGSMDGASKFVRGDAVAGLLILAINIIGGLCIGTMMYDLGIGEAFKVYGLLTIGDGLVAQIPSLLLATAAAIIVTRTSSAEDMPNQLQQQLLASPVALLSAAAVMTVIGIVPGMPTFVFLGFAAVLVFSAWRMGKQKNKVVPKEVKQKTEKLTEEAPAPTWDALPHVDLIELSVGYRLVHLVDRSKGAELVKRLTGVRRTLSEQVGFLLPEIRVRDNLGLAPNAYQIKMSGRMIATAELQPEKLMAIESGQLYGKLEGQITKDPAYGMPALWINPDNKARALNMGYSVVEHATVIATHISKVLRETTDQLLQHDDVSELNKRLAQIAPKLAESLGTALTPILQLKVYRLLLREGVPIGDIRAIATTLVESADNSKEPILLVADVRCALRANIVSQIAGSNKELQVTTLAPALEQALLAGLNHAQKAGKVSLDSFPVDQKTLQKLQQQMPELLKQNQQQAPILLVSPQLRPLISRYALAFAKGVHVLSYNEIPEDRNLLNQAQIN